MFQNSVNTIGRTTLSVIKRLARNPFKRLTFYLSYRA